MRFYLERHQFYCGIDLHAKKMFVCVLDEHGTVVLHRNMKTDPEILKRVLQPFRDGLVIGVECMFPGTGSLIGAETRRSRLSWDTRCTGRPFTVGKPKTIVLIVRSLLDCCVAGIFPWRMCIPRKMRGTRDLLRRRTFFVRRRAELLAHLQNTFTQYNVSVSSGWGRDRLRENDPTAPFADESVKFMLHIDIAVMERLDETIVNSNRISCDTRKSTIRSAFNYCARSRVSDRFWRWSC
jgi:hypothetical protein